MTSAAPEQTRLAGYYRNDPYSQSAARVFVAMTANQLKCELVAFTLEVFHSLTTITLPSNHRHWTAGSTSVVRLQCIVREKRPLLYHAVVDCTYRGTFQKFLIDAVHLQLFFYDEADFVELPVFRLLYNQHEGRCALLNKPLARQKDTKIAEHWDKQFVPQDLTALALRMAWQVRPEAQEELSRHSVRVFEEPVADLDSSAERLSLSGLGGGAPRTFSRLFNRQFLDSVLAAVEVELPFSMFISKCRVREALRDVVRTVSQMLSAVPEGARSETARIASIDQSPLSSRAEQQRHRRSNMRSLSLAETFCGESSNFSISSKTSEREKVRTHEPPRSQSAIASASSSSRRLSASEAEIYTIVTRTSAVDG